MEESLLTAAKIGSLVLTLAASAYAWRVLSDEPKPRIYLIAGFALFFVSTLFFFKQDLTATAVFYDWLKHIFVYAGLVVFYFFLAECSAAHCKIKVE